MWLAVEQFSRKHRITHGLHHETPLGRIGAHVRRAQKDDAVGGGEDGSKVEDVHVGEGRRVGQRLEIKSAATL